MAKLLEIKHPKCEKTAFYLPAMPVGRPIEHFDALTKFGMLKAQGKVVECESCGQKVDLDAINAYYYEDEAK